MSFVVQFDDGNASACVGGLLTISEVIGVHGLAKLVHEDMAAVTVFGTSLCHLLALHSSGVKQRRVGACFVV